MYYGQVDICSELNCEVKGSILKNNWFMCKLFLKFKYPPLCDHYQLDPCLQHSSDWVTSVIKLWHKSWNIMYITKNISALLHKTSILVKDYYILKEEQWLLCFDNI